MSATFSGGYSFTGSFAGQRPRSGTFAAVHNWVGQLRGLSPKVGNFTGAHHWTGYRFVGDNNIYLPADDRWRVIVQESRGGEIVARDAIVKNLVVQRALSAGCDIACDVDYRDPSVAGIYFKPWEQYIHLEKVMLGKRRIFATGIVQPSDVDPTTGVLHLKAKGFAAYPKGLPWLEDLNWVNNDAFDAPVEIWRHLQEDYPNGNLNVQLYPEKSGVEMLAGYAFDGDLFNLNFFATFVRATDKLDCGDYIDALARDIPFDYREESEWNADRTDVTKRIHLGYPRLGLIQETTAFVLNENVLSAKPHTESQTDWVSDVGVAGWFPGFEYSSTLANADPNRLRRYLDEEIARIDSNERAAAWAHRKLARRQTPPYWEEITIDPNHPNAPLGTFDVGDTITVSGFMPWVGNIRQEHKIIAIQIDTAKNTCRLQLMAEGAFNYDQIFFPDGVTNMIDNHAFNNNLTGWDATGPGWSWDGSQGRKALGSATITADGNDHDLVTQAFGVSHHQIFPASVSVMCSSAVAADDTAVQLAVQFYDDDNNPTEAVRVAGLKPAGTVPWRTLGGGSVLTPPGSTSVALRLHVGAALTSGRVWFDEAVLEL